MKNFLATLLFAFLVFIPATFVEAAYIYVPNFYNMASNRIELRIHFDGTEQKSLNGVKYTSWHYTVHDGKTHEYVNKYIRKINSKHDFHLVEQDGNSWYFAYTGGQAKYVKAFGGNFHVHVGMSGDRVVVNMVAGMHPEY